MDKFQVPNFFIKLPEEAEDASNYCFLLPTPKGSEFTPFMTIQSRKSESDKLQEFVNEQHAVLAENVENYTLISMAEGFHENIDVLLTSASWGPAGERICQIEAFYLVPQDKAYKIYCLTGTDLESHFNETEPTFKQAFSSFKPADGQAAPPEIPAP